jgi:hypothetical protein
MKSYLLSFTSYDFSKNGKTWVTSPVDLYFNKYYTNFSNKRSRTGNNLIGDYTFTGTEKTGDAFIYIDSTQFTSPNFIFETSGSTANYLLYTDTNFDILSTPSFLQTVYRTDYGEVVQDLATPSLLRLVDTSSRVDIRSFRGAFSNILGGIENITFNINVYESDSMERTVASFYYHILCLLGYSTSS